MVFFFFFKFCGKVILLFYLISYDYPINIDPLLYTQIISRWKGNTFVLPLLTRLDVEGVNMGRKPTVVLNLRIVTTVCSK